MAYTPFPAVPRDSALQGWTSTRVWDGDSFELVDATIYVGPSAESAVADGDGDQYLATD